MRTAFIYGLRCPLTGLIRYIGKCDDPQTRLPRHLSEPNKNHRTNWIASLKSQGLRPTLEVIAKVSWENWPFWERSYIRLYRCLGFDLVNGTDGGEGGETKASPESLLKRSISHTGRKHKNNTSGFVGISWATSNKKWRAQFQKSYIGLFDKLEDAVFVRALTSDKYYGNSC